MASNVELLRELFARFNETGEMDFSRVHRDVELHDRPDVPDGAASGTPIEVDEAQLWTFRGGLLVRLQAFPTIEEAYATASALDEDEGIEPAAPVSPSAVRAGARIPPSSGQSGQRRHARKFSALARATPRTIALPCLQSIAALPIVGGLGSRSRYRDELRQRRCAVINHARESSVTP